MGPTLRTVDGDSGPYPGRGKPLAYLADDRGCEAGLTTEPTPPPPGLLRTDFLPSFLPIFTDFYGLSCENKRSTSHYS